MKIYITDCVHFNHSSAPYRRTSAAFFTFPLQINYLEPAAMNSQANAAHFKLSTTTAETFLLLLMSLLYHLPYLMH